MVKKKNGTNYPITTNQRCRSVNSIKKWEDAKAEELNINETAWDFWRLSPPDGRPGNVTDIPETVMDMITMEMAMDGGMVRNAVEMVIQIPSANQFARKAG